MNSIYYIWSPGVSVPQRESDFDGFELSGFSLINTGYRKLINNEYMNKRTECERKQGKWSLVRLDSCATNTITTEHIVSCDVVVCRYQSSDLCIEDNMGRFYLDLGIIFTYNKPKYLIYEDKIQNLPTPLFGWYNKIFPTFTEMRNYMQGSL